LERGLSAILIGRIDDFYERGMPVGMWMTSPALTAILVPPLIPAALYLVGRGGLWVDHLAAVHQGGFPALNDHESAFV